MHELAITQSILEIAAQRAAAAQAVRVTDLHLVIGDLASIVDDSVQFYWDLITEGTICEGALLHFDRRPAQLTCRVCGGAYTLSGELQPCPVCGSSDILVLSGDEFFLESIEIETAARLETA